MSVYICQHSVYHTVHLAHLFLDKEKADAFWETCVAHIKDTHKLDHSYMMFEIPLNEFLPLQGEQRLQFSTDDADMPFISQKLAVECWYDVKKHKAIKSIGTGWSSHHYYNECIGEKCTCNASEDENVTDSVEEPTS